MSEDAPLSLSVPTEEDVEEGMVVLQALVEGMVLEVHVTNRQALDSTTKTPLPLVEIYTQFGSQVHIIYSVITAQLVGALYNI